MYCIVCYIVRIRYTNRELHIVGLIIAAIVIVIATGVIIHKLNKDYQSYVDSYKSEHHKHKQSKQLSGTYWAPIFGNKVLAYAITTHVNL